MSSIGYCEICGDVYDRFATPTIDYVCGPPIHVAPVCAYADPEENAIGQSYEEGDSITCCAPCQNKHFGHLKPTELFDE